MNIREALIGEGLITPAEYDDLVAGLTRVTDDPRSLVGFPRIFQVSARFACVRA